MASTQHFRRAMRGFNRQDVVSYIEYMNNQHAAQIAQLNTQLQDAQSASTQNTDLQAQLDAALARCAELEAEIASLRAGAEAPAAVQCSEDELEAYRRAERTERLARGRAAQIYAQANAVLADATVKLETAAEKMTQQLQECQNTTASAKAALQDAVASMYAIRPEEE